MVYPMAARQDSDPPGRLNVSPGSSVRRSEPGVPRPKLTVVYVLSSPHSGSTVLGILLGSHPDVFFAGELNAVPDPAWQPGRFCSCQAETRACEFWSEVRRDFETSTTPEELRRGERRFEGWSSVPKGILLHSVHSRAILNHTRHLNQLIQTIAGRSGKPIVIDSSKVAGRGLLYGWVPHDELDVRYLHVVRDGRGVVWSRTIRALRKDVGPNWRARPPPVLALLWVGANVLSTLLFSFRRGRYLRIRYEDLVADPSATLERVGRFLGVDLTEVIAAVREQRPIPVTHVVGGNRLRLNQTLTLRSDTKWERDLPEEDERIFWGIAGWLARLYGYRARTGRIAAVPAGPIL